MVGAAGGVGATTSVANLAEAAVLQGHPVLAIDLSVGNMLRLSFGMAWDDPTGLAPQLLAGNPWHAAAYRSPSGIDFVPFGASDGPTLGESLSSWLDMNDGWLATQLSALDLPRDALIFFDCSHASNAILRQVLPVADLVLLAVRADLNAIGRAHGMLKLLRGQTTAEVATVLCQFDASRQLDRDIALLFRADARYALSPVTLHQDEYLREALAQKQTVFGYAPASQAASDFRALCTWCLGRLGQKRERAA